MARLSFGQVADMRGASIAIVGKTHWHSNDEIWKTAVMGDFRRRKDGTIAAI